MKDKPNIEKIKKALAGIKDLEEIDAGGFKIVYKGSINNKTEALKLVPIPGDEHDESIGEENLRRIQREISLLSKCESPYLVKLGSMIPHELEIDGVKYVLYSEEYISGDSLRKLILAGYRPTKSD